MKINIRDILCYPVAASAIGLQNTILKRKTRITKCEKTYNMCNKKWTNKHASSAILNMQMAPNQNKMKVTNANMLHSEERSTAILFKHFLHQFKSAHRLSLWVLTFPRTRRVKRKVLHSVVKKGSSSWKKKFTN